MQCRNKKGKVKKIIITNFVVVNNYTIVKNKYRSLGNVSTANKFNLKTLIDIKLKTFPR